MLLVQREWDIKNHRMMAWWEYFGSGLGTFTIIVDIDIFIKRFFETEDFDETSFPLPNRKA